MKLRNLNVWNIFKKWIVFQYFICWILHSWNVMEWHSGTGAGVHNHILGPWTKNPGLCGRDWPGSMSMCTSPGPTCQGKMPRYGLVGLRRPLAAVPQVLTEPRTKWLHAMMASDWLIQPPPPATSSKIPNIISNRCLKFLRLHGLHCGSLQLCTQPGCWPHRLHWLLHTFRNVVFGKISVNCPRDDWAGNIFYHEEYHHVRTLTFTSLSF